MQCRSSRETRRDSCGYDLWIATSRRPHNLHGLSPTQLRREMAGKRPVLAFCSWRRPLTSRFPLGLVLLWGVIAVGMGGCSATAPGPSGVPSLYQVVADRYAHLYYPHSVPLYHLDSGATAGPNGMRPAYASTVLEVHGNWRALFGWYQHQLIEHGWHWVSRDRPRGAQVLVNHYVRYDGHELYEVAVDNPTVLTRNGYPVRPKPGDTVYEASFVARPEP